MLPFGVTIPATVPQRSEIPEGLMNNPVYKVEIINIRFIRGGFYSCGIICLVLYSGEINRVL